MNKLKKLTKEELIALYNNNAIIKNNSKLSLNITQFILNKFPDKFIFYYIKKIIDDSIEKNDTDIDIMINLYNYIYGSNIKDIKLLDIKEYYLIINKQIVKDIHKLINIKKLPSSSKWLDCSNMYGSLANHIKDKYNNLDVFYYSPLNEIYKEYQQNINNINDIDILNYKNTFNIITCCNDIENYENPISVINLLMELCTTNGYLILKCNSIEKEIDKLYLNIIDKLNTFVIYKISDLLSYKYDEYPIKYYNNKQIYIDEISKQFNIIKDISYNKLRAGAKEIIINTELSYYLVFSKR